MDFLISGILAITWKQVIMYAVGLILIYLAVKKEYEPSLLLPMGFGAILVNLPASGVLNQFMEGVRDGSCESLVKLIKTIYLRKEKRIMKGCKITAVDSRYFKLAEDFLYGELSVALDISRDEVRDYITNRIDEA